MGRPSFQIVKLRAEGNIFVGDACNCFDGTTNKKENIINPKIYWSVRDNNKGEPPVYEILVSGTIELLRKTFFYSKNMFYNADKRKI